MGDALLRFFKRHRLGSILAGVLIVLWLVPNLIFQALSGSATTCASCHVMEPYIRAWNVSVHKDVRCTTCHKLGFNYFTKMEFATWTGMYNPHPITVVDDALCIKCHPLSEIGKPVFYKNMVYFNHSLHVGKSVREMLLTCETCHPSVTHGSPLSTVDEDACISCHFIGAPRGEAITGCPSCHGSPAKTVELNGMSFNHKSYLTKGMLCNQCHLDVITGNGDVPHNRCHKCHEDRSYKYDNPVFVHNTHVTKEHLTCDRCHTKMHHGEIHMIQALESGCTDCHKGRHNSQREMYMGMGALDTPPMPDDMFSTQVSCEGCHPSRKSRALESTQRLTKAQTLKETAHACVECHGRPYDRLMYHWLNLGNSMLGYVHTAIRGAGSAINGSHRGSAVKARARKLLNAAVFNSRFVSAARPSHNIRYTQQILMDTLDLADRATRLAGAGKVSGNRPLSLQSVGASCAVLCHDTLGMPGTVKFAALGVDFPHDLHAGMGMDCAACHPTDHTMAMDIKIDACAGCHHQNKSTANCTLCHGVPASLYNGDVRFPGVPPTPNVMSGSVGCADCHARMKPGTVYAAVKGRCIACHVTSYGKLLDTWSTLYTRKYEKAELLLKNASIMLEGMDKNTTSYRRAKARYDDANAKISYLTKANGLHNMLVTDRMLNGIIAELKVR